MSKKMKVLIAVLVAVITLTVGGAMAVLAQEDNEPEPDEEALIEELAEIMPRARLFAASMGSGELLSRVAEILGISEEELEDAFAEARQGIIAERGEEALDQFLERALAEELITEEEAQAIREWWQQKPEALNRAMLRKAFSGMCPNPRALTDEACQQFKEMRRNIWQWRQGTGAQEENAGEVRAWRGNGPAASNLMPSQPRAMKAVRGRQMIAVAEGWQGQLSSQKAN
jgi:hypothetical protein